MTDVHRRSGTDLGRLSLPPTRPTTGAPMTDDDGNPTTWTRLHGPADLCECGDVPYEIGSVYGCGRDRVSISYFVQQHDGGRYTVEYRSESYTVNDDGDPNDDSDVAYEWASPMGYDDIKDAIVVADGYAADDESWLFTPNA